MKLLSRILLISLSAVLVGCATTSKVTKVDLGMSQAEVTAAIGRPYKKQASTDPTGKLVETWSYQDTTWDDGGWSWNRTIVHSNITFVNGVVANIGNAPDTHKTDNPVLPAMYALQQQQAINAYNARTTALAQPVNVNLQGTVDHHVDARVDIYEH